MRDADGAFRPNDEPATLGQLDRELRHARELIDERRETDQRELRSQAEDFKRRLVDLNNLLDERASAGQRNLTLVALLISLFNLLVAALQFAMRH